MIGSQDSAAPIAADQLTVQATVAAENTAVPGSDRWDWDDITPEVLTRLQGWDDRIQDRISTADAKASTLLGWSGTALALTSTLLVSTGLSWSGADLITTALTLCGLSLLGGCVVALILVIRPHLNAPPAYGTFVGAHQLDADVVIAMTIKAGRHFAEPAAEHVVQLAKIADRKHRRIRLATTLLLAAFVPLAIAALTAVTA